MADVGEIIVAEDGTKLEKVQPGEVLDWSRHSKIEDMQTRRTILGAIRMGATIKQACGIAGIAVTTFNRWKHRAKEGEVLYLDFFEEMAMAVDQAIGRKLQVIDQAANAGNWTAAAWWLERNFPELYGQRTRAELTGKDGDAIKIVLEWPS